MEKTTPTNQAYPKKETTEHLCTNVNNSYGFKELESK